IMSLLKTAFIDPIKAEPQQTFWRRRIPLDPPGTWCQNAALLEILKRCRAKSLIEIGCGNGKLLKLLCNKGYYGVGVAFSSTALGEASRNLENEISLNKVALVEGDLMADLPSMPEPRDASVSMMVVEHVEDDAKFVRRMAQLVRPGGHVVIGAPGGMKYWGI